MSSDFFQLPTLVLAEKLLGMELVHETTNGRLAGKIVEVEAYKGPEDKAAHSYNNRYTKRTKVMYGQPGHVYLFRIYGMHLCFNIVTGPIDKPEAILIRALEPTVGVEQMIINRKLTLHGKRHTSAIKSLTNGPGKLSQALDFTIDHYGISLTEGPIYIREHETPHHDTIKTTPRINIDYAEEAADYPWRFIIADNPFLSKK